MRNFWNRQYWETSNTNFTKVFLILCVWDFNTFVIQAFRKTVKSKIIDPSSPFVIDVFQGLCLKLLKTLDVFVILEGLRTFQSCLSFAETGQDKYVIKRQSHKLLVDLWTSWTSPCFLSGKYMLTNQISDIFYEIFFVFENSSQQVFSTICRVSRWALRRTHRY